MKYKLVDYTTEVEQNVTLGTCDMCMSTGHAIAFPYFHIQDAHGTIHQVPGFMWSWGDLFDISVENLPRFAAWLEQQDFEEPGEADNYEYTYGWLQNIVENEYNDYLYEMEELLPWVSENVVYKNDTIRIPYNDDTRLFLRDYSFDQVCRVLGIRTDKQFDRENVYQVVDNVVMTFDDDVEYATLNWDFYGSNVTMYATGYDNNGEKVSYPEVEIRDVFTTIVFTMRGDAFPEVVFEKNA